MAFSVRGTEPVDALVSKRCIDCRKGEPPEGIEMERVDFKEERGRRGAGGAVSPGETTNERAADHLAAEMACMANTPGGARSLWASPTMATG